MSKSVPLETQQLHGNYNEPNLEMAYSNDSQQMREAYSMDELEIPPSPSFKRSYLSSIDVNGKHYPAAVSPNASYTQGERGRAPSSADLLTSPTKNGFSAQKRTNSLTSSQDVPSPLASPRDLDSKQKKRHSSKLDISIDEPAHSLQISGCFVAIGGGADRGLMRSSLLLTLCFHCL
jgi:hypothetical protein